MSPEQKLYDTLMDTLTEIGELARSSRRTKSHLKLQRAIYGDSIEALCLALELFGDESWEDED